MCHHWPLPDQIPIDHDVVLCEVCPDLPSRLPWLPGVASAAFILVLPAGQGPDLDLMYKCAPHAVLHLPARWEVVLSCLAIARSQFLYERRLRGRVDKLDDILRSFRTVERAKAILIESKKISEEEAYRFLRRTAMEKRVSIGSLATTIIDSQDLLGPSIA